jgi:ADP-ribose pyrophosphatase YjhB (NUDIX family)
MTGAVVSRLERGFFRVFAWLPERVGRFGIGLFKSSWVVGAAAVVTAPDGRIMLVRHSYKVGWYTPGGFLNRGEEAADAVVREVREEVGLPIVVVGEPAVLLRTQERVVEMIFRAKVADGADPATASPKSAEITQVGWFDPDRVEELSSVTRRLLDALTRSESSHTS